MAWPKGKVFKNVDDFLSWLDQNYRDYIKKHISGCHTHHCWLPNHAQNIKYSTYQLYLNMMNYHMNTLGWYDYAVPLTIGLQGDCVLGRDIKDVPASAKYYNGTSSWHPFAYEMIGNFDKGNDTLKGVQLEAATKVSKYFADLGKPSTFHRECLINGKQPKSCPGTGISKSWFVGKMNGQTGVSETVSNIAGSLDKGDRGKEVIDLQEDLLELGYHITVDGIYGPETESAVKSFQKAQNLTVDGIAGENTLGSLAAVIKAKDEKEALEKILKGVNQDKGIGFVIVKENINMRPEPKKGYIKKVSPGKRYYVYALNDGYLKVSEGMYISGDKKYVGYYPHDNIHQLQEKRLQAGCVGAIGKVIMRQNINVRSEPNENGDFVKKAPAGQKYCVYGKENGYYKVSKGMYVSADPKHVFYDENPVDEMILKRVKVDGVQVGAYEQDENVLKVVAEALADNKKSIDIEVGE